jgi:hypothetical protein
MAFRYGDMSPPATAAEIGRTQLLRREYGLSLAQVISLYESIASLMYHAVYRWYALQRSVVALGMLLAAVRLKYGDGISRYESTFYVGFIE